MCINSICHLECNNKDEEERHVNDSEDRHTFAHDTADKQYDRHHSDPESC